MIVYGLVDIDLEDRLGLGDVIETYSCREHAEAALAKILSDEPAWKDGLRIVAIDLLGSESAN